MTENITIRPANISDTDALIDFYIKAYGDKTIFQDKTFLYHYFKSFDDRKEVFGNNVIAVNTDNKIVSHYGGLSYNLMVNGNKYPFTWSVNAYTLPEWRGKSLNSKLVNHVLDESVVVGVIGFTIKTAQFYNDLGYNTFEFNRFSRHILVIDAESTNNIINSISSGINIDIKPVALDLNSLNEKVINIDDISFGSLEFNLHESLDKITTTCRDKKFIKWRFIDNPYLSYKILAYKVGDIVKAYSAYRIIDLGNARIIRVVDLFGERVGAKRILLKLNSIANSNGISYIDFPALGSLYNDVLSQMGYKTYTEDQYVIFPQVFDPVEKRPNNEHLFLFSKKDEELVSKLCVDNVFFTLMDSDRDRVGKIKQ